MFRHLQRRRLGRGLTRGAEEEDGGRIRLECDADPLEELVEQLVER